MAAFEQFLMALQSAAFGRAARTPQTSPEQDCAAFGRLGDRCREALRYLRTSYMTENTFAGFLRADGGLSDIIPAWEHHAGADLVAGLPPEVANAILQYLHQPRVAEPDPVQVVAPVKRERPVFGVTQPPVARRR